MARGPRKNRLDFGDNPDHVTLVLVLWLGLCRAESRPPVTAILRGYGNTAMSLILDKG